jgi:hypothetical protein
MMIRTTSHRSRDRLESRIGRHPQYYFKCNGEGGFTWLDDPREIAEALAIKGISKCRDQDIENYNKCWSMGLEGAHAAAVANHRGPFGPGA